MKISISLDEGANHYAAQLFWIEIIYPIGDEQDNVKLYFLEGLHKDYHTGEIIYKSLASKADREKIAEFFGMQGLNDNSYALMRKMFAQNIEYIIGKVLDACIVFRAENRYIDRTIVSQGTPEKLTQYFYEENEDLFFDKPEFFFPEWCEEPINYLVRNSSYSYVSRGEQETFEQYFTRLIAERIKSYWKFPMEIKFEKFKTQAKEHQLLEVASKTRFHANTPWMGHRAGFSNFGPLTKKV